MNSAIYEGWVRHRRLAPVAHDFRYALYMLYLDLDELDDVFRGRWLWSAKRRAPIRFRREDHLGDPRQDLRESVRDLVERETGRRPGGPIRLLTHPAYLGYGFNPVSFYYCYGNAAEALEAIVAEVNNTPWGERHPYVMRWRAGEPRRVRRFEFDKAFHVSPFMPMSQRYVWRYAPPGERLFVHMENHEGGARLFDATLVMRRTPLTGGALARVLVQYPLMTAKVIAAIHFEALRLWLKGTPIHTHPAKLAASNGNPHR